MYIKRETLKKRIEDARNVLIKKGICAIDGSGNSIVEGAMNLLSLLAVGELEISTEEVLRDKEFYPGEIDQLRLLAIEYGIGSWSYRSDTGCYHRIIHEEQFTLTIEDMIKRVRPKIIEAKTRVNADYDCIERLKQKSP